MIQLVRLCTGLDDEALRELNRSAAVLFLPLREAAANALLEAMSSGLPVVTTDRPATRESAGDCSVYFEPGSVPQAVSGLGGAPAERSAPGPARAGLPGAGDEALLGDCGAAPHTAL